MSTEATTQDQNIHGTALVNKQDPDTVTTNAGTEKLPTGDDTATNGAEEEAPKPEPTFGQRLVGLDPDDTVMEHSVKLHFAEIADMVKDAESAGKGPHDFKDAALAAIKNACAMTIRHLCPKG